MARLKLTLMTLVASASFILCSRQRTRLRVLYGVPDTENKYYFVVAILSEFKRFCSGTLISSEWVLTAAHCSSIDYDNHGLVLTHVQYGDMTKPPNCTETKAAIVEQISHPGFRTTYLGNDIALLRVTPIQLPLYGKISAVDFKSVIGVAVEYAGFGITEFDDDAETRPLRIGKGLLLSCSEETDPAAFICVAPKCSNKYADSDTGDGGGPLFYDQKILGIVCTGGGTPVGIYTAVSPYITWINDVMNSD